MSNVPGNNIMQLTFEIEYNATNFLCREQQIFLHHLSWILVSNMECKLQVVQGRT